MGKGTIVRTSESDYPQNRWYYIIDADGNVEKIRVTRSGENEESAFYEELIPNGDDRQGSLAARMTQTIFKLPAAAHEVSIEVQTVVGKGEVYYGVTVSDIRMEESKRDGFKVFENLLAATTGISDIQDRIPITISP